MDAEVFLLQIPWELILSFAIGLGLLCLIIFLVVLLSGGAMLAAL